MGRAFSLAKLRSATVVLLALASVTTAAIAVEALIATRDWSFGDPDLKTTRRYLELSDRGERNEIRLRYRAAWHPMSKRYDDWRGTARFRPLPGAIKNDIGCVAPSERGDPQHELFANPERTSWGPLLIYSDDRIFFDGFTGVETRNMALIEPSLEAGGREIVLSALKPYAVAGLTGLAILFGAYPTLTLVQGPVRRYRRAVRGRCAECGYSLKGLPYTEHTDCASQVARVLEQRLFAAKRSIPGRLVLGATLGIIAPCVLFVLQGLFPDATAFNYYSVLGVVALPAARLGATGVFQMFLGNIAFYAFGISLSTFAWRAFCPRARTSRDLGDDLDVPVPAPRCPECGMLI